MEEKLSYLSLRRVVNSLKILGVYPIDPDSPKMQRWWHAIYRRVILTLGLVYIIQEILQIYQVRHDADKVIATMFLFLTYTAFIYKSTTVNFKSKQIEHVLDIMKGPVFNQGETEHREPLLKTVKRALIIGPIFNLVAIFTSILMNLHPVIFHIQGNLIEFQIWLPFDPNVDPQFYMALFYNLIHVTHLALGNTMSDMLIVFLLEQCKTQISILRLDIECIVEKSHNEQIKTRQTFKDIYEKRFKKIVLHHNEIMSMAIKIDDIFGGAVLYQFILGGWILCTSVYNMTNVNVASVEFISMITYLLAILMEYFLYCHFGNDVTIESDILSRSVYEMDWLSLSVKHRRSILIFMEKCKQPITPMAGKIIPLSNKTFVSILRSSFSFYTFLKNSNNN